MATYAQYIPVAYPSLPGSALGYNTSTPNIAPFTGQAAPSTSLQTTSQAQQSPYQSVGGGSTSGSGSGSGGSGGGLSGSNPYANDPYYNPTPGTGLANPIGAPGTGGTSAAVPGDNPTQPTSLGTNPLGTGSSTATGASKNPNSRIPSSYTPSGTANPSANIVGRGTASTATATDGSTTTPSLPTTYPTTANYTPAITAGIGNQTDPGATIDPTTRQYTGGVSKDTTLDNAAEDATDAANPYASIIQNNLATGSNGYYTAANVPAQPTQAGIDYSNPQQYAAYNSSLGAANTNAIGNPSFNSDGQAMPAGTFMGKNGKVCVVGSPYDPDCA